MSLTYYKNKKTRFFKFVKDRLILSLMEDLRKKRWKHCRIAAKFLEIMEDETMAVSPVEVEIDHFGGITLEWDEGYSYKISETAEKGDLYEQSK